MASLTARVEQSLDETRILILGAEVLVGFQYRAVFEPGFERLSTLAQYLKVGGLGLLVVAVGLLIAPGAYHQLVLGGEDSPRVPAFTGRIASWALLPIAFAMAIDFFVAAEVLWGGWASMTALIAVALLALGLWYGVEWAMRARIRAERPLADELRDDRRRLEDEEQMKRGTKLETKITQVLTESRVVLPGAQALFGFQFTAMLTDAFEKLPAADRVVHFASLGCVALAVMLLMAPAAFHRIVEQGENTERLHRFAGRAVVGAMVPLALGIGGDLYVVLDKVTKSPMVALLFAGLAIAFNLGLWFGLTSALRASGRGAPAPAGGER